jgi:hypothetical protein
MHVNLRWLIERPPDELAVVVVPIEFAVHNPAHRVVQTIPFMPILISPSIFNKCVSYEHNSSTHFQSIKLPDGSYVHRPLNYCSVEPGGWDNVLFNLHCYLLEGTLDIGKLQSEFDFLLRILSDAPARDFPFKVTVIPSSGQRD